MTKTKHNSFMLGQTFYKIAFLVMWERGCVAFNDQTRPFMFTGGRRSPAVACWASDHRVASSNPLRGKFCH